MRIAGVVPMKGKFIYGSLKFEKLQIPFVIGQGVKDGPTFLVTAAQHATEMVGVAVIQKLVNTLDLTKLSGTLLMIPFVSPHSVAWKKGIMYPGISDKEKEDILKNCKKTNTSNINRVWPGKENGSFNERLAFLIWNEFVIKADALLDYHCMSLWEELYADAWHNHEKSIAFAASYGTKHVITTDANSYADGLLYIMAAKLRDIPSALVEATPNFVVIPKLLEKHMRGITNMMKYLKMLPGKIEGATTQSLTYMGDSTKRYKAKIAGIAGAFKGVGDVVKKGELLIEVRDFQTFKPKQRIYAPFDGTPVCIGAYSPNASTGQERNFAIVKPGDHICDYRKIRRALKSKDNSRHKEKI